MNVGFGGRTRQGEFIRPSPPAFLSRCGRNFPSDDEHGSVIRDTPACDVGHVHPWISIFIQFQFPQPARLSQVAFGEGHPRRLADLFKGEELRYEPGSRMTPRAPHIRTGGESTGLPNRTVSPRKAQRARRNCNNNMKKALTDCSKTPINAFLIPFIFLTYCTQ